jgi:hypothetical protein
VGDLDLVLVALFVSETRRMELYADSACYVGMINEILSGVR